MSITERYYTKKPNRNSGDNLSRQNTVLEDSRIEHLKSLRCRKNKKRMKRIIGGKKREWLKIIFEKIINENFINLMIDVNLRIQEAQ